MIKIKTTKIYSALLHAAEQKLPLLVNYFFIYFNSQNLGEIRGSRGMLCKSPSALMMNHSSVRSTAVHMLPSRASTAALLRESPC